MITVGNYEKTCKTIGCKISQVEMCIFFNDVLSIKVLELKYKTNSPYSQNNVTLPMWSSDLKKINFKLKLFFPHF